MVAKASVDKTACVVIESEKSHVLCFPKKSFIEKFEEAMVMANEIAVALEEISNAGEYSSGSAIEGAIF